MRSQRFIFVAVASVVLTLAVTTAASAHAEIKQAQPAVGGSVPTMPTEVRLNFNEKLESTFSSLVVRNAVGKRVDKADGRIDQKDRTVMRVSLQPLRPGTYIVIWRALTADTHRTEGAFIFRVGE
jgi:copper resistance protein C